MVFKGVYLCINGCKYESQASHGDHARGGLHAGSRPGIESETDSVALVGFADIGHLVIHQRFGVNVHRRRGEFPREGCNVGA